MNNNNKNLEKKPFDRKSYEKEYQKEYRKKNADKNKQYQKVYQSLNAEKIKKQRDLYRKENKEKIKNNRIKNKEKTKIYNKAYREKKKEIIKQDQKERYYLNKEKDIEKIRQHSRKNSRKYRETHREKVRASQKKFRENNKDKCKKNRSNWWKKKFHSDPIFRLLHNARNRICEVLNRKSIKKSQTTISLIGCSSEFLKKYLQSKFIQGMSWENYGYMGWHVDHIIPCSSFDFSDKNQLKKCFHYTNLQPLWWLDNIKKSDKIL
jgi:hypothetical protein